MQHSTDRIRRVEHVEMPLELNRRAAAVYGVAGIDPATASTHEGH